MISARIANCGARSSDQKTLTHQDLENINSIIENIFTSLESTKQDLTQAEKEDLLKRIEDRLQKTQDNAKSAMLEDEVTQFLSQIL
ncbi:MAG: hypothetical protein S4CHLAM20_10150 [Chlamydiia bacterium]|nr:hypothetical protein [Chlamydiia bacterium]